MSVKLVSRTELIAILNERMRSYGEEEATVADVIRLRHPDQTGCNWMPDFASASSSAALLDVFAHARREFNLE
jgi:hypothetical protein